MPGLYGQKEKNPLIGSGYLACTHICYLEDGEVKDYYPVDENTASKTYEILFSDLSG